MQTKPDYQNIIRKHQRQAPVRLSQLAKDLDVDIKVTDMGDDISGSLHFDQNIGRWKISVNRRHTKERQRFTIAHELAHLFLHTDEIGTGILEDDMFYRSRLTNKMEREANQMAADILMPWARIRDLTKQGYKSPEDLAEALNVSVPAMYARLGLPT